MICIGRRGSPSAHALGASDSVKLAERWSQRAAFSPNAYALKKRIQRPSIFRYNQPCPRPPASHSPQGRFAIPLGCSSPARCDPPSSCAGNSSRGLRRIPVKLDERCCPLRPLAALGSSQAGRAVLREGPSVRGTMMLTVGRRFFSEEHYG